MKIISQGTLLLLIVLCLNSPVAAEISGSFVGNGKNAKLAYLSAVRDKTSSGEEIALLVFTEKDPGADKKPEDKALAGEYGSALIVRILKSGEVYGSEVRHSALSNPSFTSIGTLLAEDFKWEAAKVSGKLTTKGPAKFFKDTWEVALSFNVPLS